MVSARQTLAFCSSVLCRKTVPHRPLPVITAGLLALTYSSSTRPSSCASSSLQMTPNTNGDNDDAIGTTGYLNAEDAYALDVELMASPGFTLEQLMELAGLSVAQAVYEVLPADTKSKILLVCGPGNNGGDGLVAARHLSLFGHECVLVYPKRSSKQPHYTNLVKQCEDLSIPILDEMPSSLDDDFDCVVDAIFGFSFQGTPREPFATILQQMIDFHGTVVSVDVPSGWHVDEGDVAQAGFNPDVLISLTAPKLCSKTFQGRHFVGGRFLPPALAEKYGIQMPPYEGSNQIIELLLKKDEDEEANWEEGYAAFCAEKEAELVKQDSSEKADSESWEAQYHEHCIQKEKEIAEREAAKRNIGGES